ncbi:hypothetical protein PNA2_1643 [Pyrococcus sp. NA2]|uniref:hypothetical protein n=1 Tax=Pyrococcus sp. (strain NA2) TaxID=342949 RepID=UPI000209AA2C|nr:hypothetical protein [Pyrococcus sp. NA2]AEC52558.1 hypothetical protein PNA2_1643 [Pyrococcus sp. NA2]
MRRLMIGALLILLVLTLPGASALSLSWSESGVYPIYLDSIEQSGNIAVVTWNVPPNCLSGYGTVLISKDRKVVAEEVDLGRLKPWGKKVAVILNVREPIYVKLRIISGNGVFMSSWVRLTPRSSYASIKGEVRPQFIQIGVAIVVVGLTLWDAYDTYKTCKEYGVDSIQCIGQGTFFIVGLAIPGDEGIKFVTKLGKKFGVTDDIYRILKRTGIINYADEVIEKFTHIFDDIVKHGDEAAKALDDLVKAGVSKEAIEETVKHGATIKAVKEGIEKFAEKSSYFIVENGGRKYKVVLEKGNEKSGLLHAFLRHVWGYKMEQEGITTFWPMGQKIIVNGEAKQLPRVFRDERELREFLDEVVEKALKDPDYQEKFFKKGVPKPNFRISVDLKKVGVNVDGIDVVRLEFKFEDGKFVLKTAYPEKGWAVETFIPGKGGWQ